ncbi:MAG: SRPBCC family protein [Chloroflexi bacterium]|nr:SRPBCC family protein [Chloroflexota bacterium]
MIKNEHEVVINCPTERVLRFVADFNTWPQWHGSGQNQVEKVTPGHVDVGTVWKVSGLVRGQLITMTIEVTEYEPNSQYGFRTTSGPVDARQIFTWSGLKGGRGSPPSLNWPIWSLLRPLGSSGTMICCP